MKAIIRIGARLKKWVAVDSNRWRIVVVAFLILLLADHIYEWTVIPEPPKLENMGRNGHIPSLWGRNTRGTIRRRYPPPVGVESFQGLDVCRYRRVL
jgi:hypothetical protein